MCHVAGGASLAWFGQICCICNRADGISQCSQPIYWQMESKEETRAVDEMCFIGPPFLAQSSLLCPSCCWTQRAENCHVLFLAPFHANAAWARQSIWEGFYQSKSFASPVVISKPHFSFCRGSGGKVEVFKAQSLLWSPKLGKQKGLFNETEQTPQEPMRATPPCRSDHFLSKWKMASQGLQHRGRNQRAFEGLKTKALALPFHPTRSPSAWLTLREVAKIFYHPIHEGDTHHIPFHATLNSKNSPSWWKKDGIHRSTSSSIVNVCNIIKPLALILWGLIIGYGS